LKGNSARIIAPIAGAYVGGYRHAGAREVEQVAATGERTEVERFVLKTLKGRWE
jgi:hypothetical protein